MTQTPDQTRWDAPGTSRVISLANLVKAKVTGRRIDGDNETVEL